MDEAARNRLFEDYAKNRSPEIREQIILEYAPLVKLVAGRLSMYLGYNVEYDDLVGYGVFGLIDAIDKYDNMKAVKFETYASLRIRGAILDQIRKMDWIPRTLRQKQKKLETTMGQMETELGRTPTNEELAAALEMTQEELDALINQTQVANLVSLDEYLEQGSEVRVEAGNKSAFLQPEQVMERQDLKRLLAEAINSLTEKEQKVIALYYYEEMTLKEISNILEVSESRVSQLHTKSLRKMKEKLGARNMGVLGIWNI